MKMIEDEVIKILKEKGGWHTFISFIPLVNNLISAEQAQRSFLSNNHRRQVTRELQAQIRSGRRRILAETFRDLRYKKVIESRDFPTDPNSQDYREYHLIDGYVPKESKIKKDKKKKVNEESKEVKENCHSLEEAVYWIDFTQGMVQNTVANSQTKDDIIGMFRILKRLVIDVGNGASTPIIPKGSISPFADQETEQMIDEAFVKEPEMIATSVVTANDIPKTEVAPTKEMSNE